MAPDLSSLPVSPRSTERTLPKLAGSDSANSVGSSRPNILYIIADQLAAPLLKVYNHRSQIKTPNLDALAGKAVVFDSAYCPSPLCGPSRMSMITGQLPTKINAYDNACSISPDTPTYAHYLRVSGYETVLAGKMHFIGEQLHGFENRLTTDIYPGDYGWTVDWEKPDTRLEWYHNASSILQAGPCVRSNQLDYDEEVVYKSTQFMYDHVRKGSSVRPFCMTISLTHPHDPYTIEEKYWNLYDGVNIELPQVTIQKENQDAHSKRLLKVCDLWQAEISDDQIKKARRAYYGAVSYVDDCIGRILTVLKECRLQENTIIIFSSDHGDMLGERGLWYKMTYFESSARVPLLIHYPKLFKPNRVLQNVSTLDILPTLIDIVGTRPKLSLPIDGKSLLPQLQGQSGDDTVFGEYCGEGSIAPLMMIRCGQWKFIICPTDEHQLYDLGKDPLELHNLANSQKAGDPNNTITKLISAFTKVALEKWDFEKIIDDVKKSQRQRRFVWSALKKGTFTSWDYTPPDDGRKKNDIFEPQVTDQCKLIHHFLGRNSSYHYPADDSRISDKNRDHSIHPHISPFDYKEIADLVHGVNT